MYKQVFKHISLIAVATVIMPLSANADGKFTNALTKIDFVPSANDSIKMNIYTKNPYNDKVKITKKNDSYTIVVPKTDNWISTKQNLEKNPNIKKVSLKTYSGISKDKNYTKITVETKKPLTISTQPLFIQPKVRTEPIPTEKATPISIETPSVANRNFTNPTDVKPVALVKVQPIVQAPVMRVQAAPKPLVKPTPKPYIQPSRIDILDIPASKLLRQKEETAEDFLLIQNGRETQAIEEHKQEEETAKQVDVSTISKSLMKETPKQLTSSHKFRFNFKFKKNKTKTKKSANIVSRPTLKKLCSVEYNIKLFKLLAKVLFVLICLGGLGFGLYSIFKKNKSIEEILDGEPTEEEVKESELQKAMDEFVEVEQHVEKLQSKEYIKNVNDYKNLDGFKTYELDTDILKTLDAIEKASKHSSPLIPAEEDNKLMGYNYVNNKQLYKNPLEELTEEEEKALFDDDSDENFGEDETISSQYYNNTDEFFSLENSIQPNDDIFIVEDDEEEAEEEPQKIEIIEEPVEPVVEEASEPEVVEPEQNSDVENLKVREKYEIDEKTGIALVNYHQVFALIGYIGSNIFLLKKFENGISPEDLSVRLSEKINDETKHYIVKLDREKWLVEVSPKRIKLLLGL